MNKSILILTLFLITVSAGVYKSSRITVTRGVTNTLSFGCGIADGSGVNLQTGYSYRFLSLPSWLKVSKLSLVGIPPTSESTWKIAVQYMNPSGKTSSTVFVLAAGSVSQSSSEARNVYYMNGSLIGNSIVGGSQASYVIFFPYISRSGALTADALSGSGICGVFELDLKASVKALNGLEVDIVYWQRQLTSTNKFLKSLEERRKQLESEISKGVNIAVTNQINSYTNESNFLQNQIQYITNNIQGRIQEINYLKKAVASAEQNYYRAQASAATILAVRNALQNAKNNYNRAFANRIDAENYYILELNKQPGNQKALNIAAAALSKAQDYESQTKTVYQNALQNAQNTATVGTVSQAGQAVKSARFALYEAEFSYNALQESKFSIQNQKVAIDNQLNQLKTYRTQGILRIMNTSIVLSQVLAAYQKLSSFSTRLQSILLAAQRKYTNQLTVVDSKRKALKDCTSAFVIVSCSSTYYSSFRTIPGSGVITSVGKGYYTLGGVDYYTQSCTRIVPKPGARKLVVFQSVIFQSYVKGGKKYLKALAAK